MEEENKYYVVKRKAIPEVLLKVVEAKKLLNHDRNMTISEAADRVNISRSSFYKYKDDIFLFNDTSKGRTITLAMQILDERGLLSEILSIVSKHHANILTIHQSIPLNGMASISLSAELAKDTGNVSKMLEELENKEGIIDVKTLARE